MIYICIPAHDEAPTIGLLLWKIRRVMEEFPRDYEIIVLDDGSTDGTQDVLAPYGRVLPLTVLSNPERRGYAPAVERLLREVVARASHPRRDMAIVLDADFSDPPEDLPLLVKRVEGGVDLVVATPVQHDATEPRAMRWARKGLPLLLRKAPVAEGVTDPLSGYRAYRVALLKKVLAEQGDAPLLSLDGWAARVELLLAMAPHSRRAESVEIALRPARRQRATRFNAWNTFVQMWEVSRRPRRPSAVVEASDAAA